MASFHSSSYVGVYLESEPFLSIREQIHWIWQKNHIDLKDTNCAIWKIFQISWNYIVFLAMKRDVLYINS